MAKRALGRAAGIAAAVLACGILSASGYAPAPRPPLEVEWIVTMTVSARGEYALESRARANGRYALKMTWTGGLERDGEDYILLKGKAALTEWTAEESASAPGGIQVLTTDDFEETPELNVAYALVQGGRLHLSFLVRGFEVPLSFPDNMFYLQMPASAESQERPGGVNYNIFVKTGSNAIVMDNPAGAAGPQEKTFRWTWLRRAGISVTNRGYFESNRHEAEVTVVIRPAGSKK